MFELHGASVLLQWATGGLFFLWITTRRREVGIGYGWSIRLTYMVVALLSLAVGLSFGVRPVRELASAGVVIATAIALGQSWTRRKAGVAKQRSLAETRSARVAAMTGIDTEGREKFSDGKEFDPRLDMIAPAIGLIGLIAAGIAAGDPAWLQIARMIVGALFLGAVSDAMLLGHWYLVQPGLSREPLKELVKWTGFLWFPEMIVLLLPTGMISALNGSIDDGYGGILSWYWVVSSIATAGLVLVTWFALKEKQYSAVMAATGLLYLAILTAFGQDLVARAVLGT